MKNANTENDRQAKIFLNNLTVLRRRNGLSKKRMAAILDISVGTLNKLEQGTMPPRVSVEIVFNAADYFGIPVAELFWYRLE